MPVLVRSKIDENTVVKTYAVIDDQSNRTIATSQLLDKFDVCYALAVGKYQPKEGVLMI